MKTILVTGCAGFIGSHVAEKLLERGDRVIGIDEINDYYKVEQKQGNLKILEKFENFKFYKKDLAEFEEIKEIFEKENIEFIGHLAARAGVRPSIENPFIYERSNVAATLNLLELAKDFEIKNFVLTSSSSVYGNCQEIPFCEDFKLDTPISPYAASKKSTELFAYTYHSLYNLNVNVIRPFTIYGPRGRPDMAPFIFTSKIAKGEIINKFGDGSTMRDYTFIEDFANGFVSAIYTPLGYEIFNFGNSSPVSLNEFISTIEEVVGKKASINQMGMQMGDVDKTYADTSKAEMLLGFKTETPLKKGIEEFYKWYKEFYKE